MRLTQLTAAVALCGVTVHVPSAWADNTTCANAEYLFPGEVASDSVPSRSAQPLNRVFFKTAVVAGRSYSIAAWDPLTDPGEVAGGPSLSMSTHINTCASGAPVTGAGRTEPEVDLTDHLGDRLTVIPTFTGTLWIEVQNLRFGPATLHIRVVETTLFSPWWFVGGTNQAFAEIRNNTNETVHVNATFFRSDGTPCGSTAFNLTPNGNTAVGVKFLGTCATAVSGSAQVAFHSAPGAVAANITTIDAVQGTSFDSPFTPRMVWGGSLR